MSMDRYGKWDTVEWAVSRENSMDGNAYNLFNGVIFTVEMCNEFLRNIVRLVWCRHNDWCCQCDVNDEKNDGKASTNRYAGLLVSWVYLTLIQVTPFYYYLLDWLRLSFFVFFFVYLLPFVARICFQCSRHAIFRTEKFANNNKKACKIMHIAISNKTNNAKNHKNKWASFHSFASRQMWIRSARSEYFAAEMICWYNCVYDAKREKISFDSNVIVFWCLQFSVHNNMRTSWIVRLFV